MLCASAAALLGSGRDEHTRACPPVRRRCQPACGAPTLPEHPLPPGLPARQPGAASRLLALAGGGVHDSHVVKGMVLKRGVEGSISSVTDAKVAVFAQGVDTASTETKVRPGPQDVATQRGAAGAAASSLQKGVLLAGQAGTLRGHARPAIRARAGGGDAAVDRGCRRVWRLARLGLLLQPGCVDL